VNPFRVSPIYFQPLEQELEPVVRYLTGHMLNAGCGTRDIGPYLRRNGVSDITRYDLASNESDVITGPLEAMPFDDESFDSVLCNAVLEHVGDAPRSMRELARVVRTGGHVVVAVPFLQPYHPSPGDFQRYTADGLTRLGRLAGLDLVEIRPVHSFAQTLGWLLWEHAREKGGRLRKAATWLIAFVLTRLRSRTDPKLVKNANTYQAVFVRTESKEQQIVGKEWRLQPLPAVCAKVPTMLVPDELRLLHHLAAEYWSGAGAIIDAGAFLGGSTVALADGLRHNPHRRRYGAQKPIHSFDRFEVEEYSLPFFPEGTAVGDSFREQFEQNIAPYADIVEVHPGDVMLHSWNGGAIEILFVDLAKHWRVSDWITWQFFPHLIPGRSLVVQQDYLYHHWVAWLHVTMELYADYFEYICDTDVNSVVFLNTKKIPDTVLRRNSVESLTLAEKTELMERAANRFDGPKRELMLSAKAHFTEMLQAS